jgi:biopolymer transport protein ExbB/TolQ
MTPAPNAERPVTRSSTTAAAFVLGVPLAVGVLALIQFGPLQAYGLKRYIEHPVEIVEVVLFCCALGALGAKAFANLGERAACRRELLPPWDGMPVPVAEASKLRAILNNNVGRLRGSWLARRLDAVLDFMSKRGSGDGLDDQLRALADTDALVLDNSYSLIRFITWAIPILGFLGTVLGITKAIAGVTPEVLEKSLSSVTEGLSLAFDTTAVGLALTMVTMFLSFLTERLEQSVLEYVDHYAEVQLAHRFERTGADQSEFTLALRQNSQVLLQATEKLVHQQAAVWANALAAAQQHWAEAGQQQQQQLTAALEGALERTLSAHQARLTAVEQHVEKQSGALIGQLGSFAEAVRQMGREHQESLARVTAAVASQTDAMARLQDDGQQLIRLQDALHQNLAALRGAGAFEEAVQSLTAAIHLLTVKVVPGASGPVSQRLSARPGAAA